MAAIRNPAAFAAWQARQQQAQQEAQAAQQVAMIAAMQQQAQERPVVHQESTPLGAFKTVFSGGEGTAAQTLWGGNDSPTQSILGGNREPEVQGRSQKKNRSWGNVNSAVYDLWEK